MNCSSPNFSENKQYFFHKDHASATLSTGLGSSTQISDISANIIHHIEYMPYGETFVEQRSNWGTNYKFNGKELDEETGFYYYGARYYNPDISIWLSIDPLSDKYPSMSPYMYCAGNPVILVDPDGREVEISGEAAQQAAVQLNNKTSKKFNVHLGEDGKLSYTGKARTKNDKFLKTAIDDKNVKVNLIANNSNEFISVNGENLDYENKLCGGYGGNQITESFGEIPVFVEAYQYYYPNRGAQMDSDIGDKKSGGYALHEIAEAYFGATYALNTGKSSPRYGLDGSTYEYAHRMANKIMGGEYTHMIDKSSYTDSKGNVRYIIKESYSRNIKGGN